VALDGGALVVDGSFHLVPIEPRRFVVKEEPALSISFATDGAMRVDFPGGGFDFARAVATWTADQRAALAGRYRSDELDVVWTVAVDGERLELRGVRDDPEELVPVDVDLLATGGGLLRVERDKRGAVTGFVVDAGRIRGLGFSRQP
jgi:hypothetical protein